MTQNFFKYIPVYQKFSKIVQLYAEVFSVIWRFSILFCIFILMFALLDYVLALELLYQNYTITHYWSRIFMYSYQNSINDVNGPSNLLTKNGLINMEFQSTQMTFLVWTVWFLTQFMCMIIMLNFLISIISACYNRVMSMENYSKYIHRCYMNKDYVDTQTNLFSKWIYKNPYLK